MTIFRSLAWLIPMHHRIGFGDICPGKTDLVGRIFLTVLPILGLGFFCGPILDLSSSWQRQIPGGSLALGTFTIAMGVSMLTTLEGLSYPEAIHLCVITGKKQCRCRSPCHWHDEQHLDLTKTFHLLCYEQEQRLDTGISLRLLTLVDSCSQFMPLWLSTWWEAFWT